MAGFVSEPLASSVASVSAAPVSNKRPRLERALDEAEERRITQHGDERYLQLSRDLKRRNDPDARLPSVAALSTAARALANFILLIPPYERSLGLRSQHLLRLTDLVGDGVCGYDLGSSAAKTEVFELLRLFDTAWVATLQGRDWDASLQLPIARHSESLAPIGRVSGTDKARLLSLVLRIREGVRTAMSGPPELNAGSATEDDEDDIVDGYLSDETEGDTGRTDAGITAVGSVLGATQQTIARIFERTLTALEARD